MFLWVFVSVSLPAIGAPTRATSEPNTFKSDAIHIKVDKQSRRSLHIKKSQKRALFLKELRKLYGNHLTSL